MTELVRQGQLRPTLLALAAREGLANIDDNTSSVYSISSLASLSKGDGTKTLLLSSSQSDIPLIINHWAQQAAQPRSTSPQKDQGKSFIQTFIDIGIAHGLGPDSHPISVLREALRELSNDHAPKEGSARRCVAHNSLVRPSFTAQLRDFVFDGIPVFNIWDSIALIYSISIEPTSSDREVELFLYQLRLIFISMRNTRCWGSDHFPSTVAATWTSPTKDGLVLAAFAVSCIKGRNGSLRNEQNLARQNYNQRLHQLVTCTAEEIKARGEGQNLAGNCPEFTTWATICREPGSYFTLCLNIALELTMQCCGSCLETRKAASTVGIIIEDLWQTCSLVSVFGKEEVNNGEYKIKEMDPINQILKKGRKRRVLRRRRE
jgi:hypothetical protein